MSPLKDWLNLFAVSISATVSACKHERVWKQHTTFLNQARDDSKRCTVTKVFFALKRRTDITWNKLLSPVKTGVWYRMHESELENGLYYADNARMRVEFYHKENNLTFLV